jgi:hypothetical protein
MLLGFMVTEKKILMAFITNYIYALLLFYGATARGGPWPPLQYVSKLLNPLLYLSIRLLHIYSYMKTLTSWDGTSKINSGFYAHLNVYSENMYVQHHETKLCHYRNDCTINFSSTHPVKSHFMICAVKFVIQLSYKDTNAIVFHFMLMKQTHVCCARLLGNVSNLTPTFDSASLGMFSTILKETCHSRPLYSICDCFPV